MTENEGAKPAGAKAMASVRRIPGHGRGAIENLVPSEGGLMVSILPLKDGVHRIGDRASDVVGKAAAQPCCGAQCQRI
jgi:hypothetical protein